MHLNLNRSSQPGPPGRMHEYSHASIRKVIPARAPGPGSYPTIKAIVTIAQNAGTYFANLCYISYVV